MDLFENNDENDITARIIDFFKATPGEHRMGRITKHLGIEGCSGMAYEKMRDKLTAMAVTGTLTRVQRKEGGHYYYSLVERPAPASGSVVTAWASQVDDLKREVAGILLMLDEDIKARDEAARRVAAKVGRLKVASELIRVFDSTWTMPRSLVGRV